MPTMWTLTTDATAGAVQDAARELHIDYISVRQGRWSEVYEQGEATMPERIAKLARYLRQCGHDTTVASDT